MYEYRCQDCQQVSTRLVFSWTSDAQLTCKTCSSENLTKLVSRFSVKKSWGDSLNWVPGGETLTDVNEDDPYSIDHHMGRIKTEMGGQTTSDFFEEMRRELFTGPKSFDPPDHGHDH
jgi:putative FmdB family regulatory protein